MPEEEPYLLVLKKLAISGPTKSSEIREYCYQGKYPKKRGAESFRENFLRGSSKKEGMVRAEYIFEKIKRRRFDNSEYVYYLQPKGILASIQTNTSLNENKFFEKIIEYADNNTVGKKQTKIIKQFLKAQIELFLSYHFLNGMTLTWQSNFSDYYWKFFKNIQKGITLVAKNPTEIKEFRKIVEEYVVQYSTIMKITGKITEKEGGFPSVYDGKINVDLEWDRKNWYYNVINWTCAYEQTIVNAFEGKPKKKIRYGVKQRDSRNAFHTYQDWSYLKNRVEEEVKKSNEFN